MFDKKKSEIRQQPIREPPKIGAHAAAENATAFRPALEAHK
jgi:hypothetical protein